MSVFCHLNRFDLAEFGFRAAVVRIRRSPVFLENYSRVLNGIFLEVLMEHSTLRLEGDIPQL
jgi:hypothetical protein